MRTKGGHLKRKTIKNEAHAIVDYHLAETLWYLGSFFSGPFMTIYFIRLNIYFPDVENEKQIYMT